MLWHILAGLLQMTRGFNTGLQPHVISNCSTASRVYRDVYVSMYGISSVHESKGQS